MAPLSLFALLGLAASSGLAASVNFTDADVAPVPHAQYARSYTLWGNGTRTYSCNPKGDNTYKLTDLNYNLYPTQPMLNTTLVIGRRVLLAKEDDFDGTFAFYTKIGAFTYWVGRAVKTAEDPSQTTEYDLPAELELVTERSEPKPHQATFDLGVATYITRYGAVGGLLPNNTKCTAATAKVIVPNTVYYSFWNKLT